MFLIRCKGTENKWYMQEFYTFMNDFFENYTLLWTTFLKILHFYEWLLLEYYIFMNDFLSYNKIRGEILKKIIDNYLEQKYGTKCLQK
jgi:hypothetical protein